MKIKVTAKTKSETSEWSSPIEYLKEGRFDIIAKLFERALAGIKEKQDVRFEMVKI